MKALAGVVILDCTRLLPGAVATNWMRQFGAEVIKIEQPGIGDYARTMFSKGENPTFTATNGSKRSLALDLKHPRGKAAFLRMVPNADIVIEGFRPGVMDRLGVGYAALEAVNSRIIYAALTGYGPDGPYADLAGHDVNYLSLAGVLDLIGPAGGAPVIPGIQIADLAGGSMQAVIGMLLALAARERTGRGQRVDISMTDGAAGLLTVALGALRATGHVSRRGEEILSGGLACYSVYECADGRYVSVGALEKKFWETLCRELGLDHLIPDHLKPDRQAALKQELAAKFREQPAEEWFRVLGFKETCVAPVRTVAEAAADPHFAAHPIGMVPRMSDTPPETAGRPPALGEHTDAVLARFGFDADEVADLRREGAVA